MVKTFLKRTIATIGAFLSYVTAHGGWEEFRGADTGIELFRGLFFGILGIVAFLLFVRDFIRNRWPLEGINDGAE